MDDGFTKGFQAGLMAQVDDGIGLGRRLRDKGEKGYTMAGGSTKRLAKAPQRPHKGGKVRPPPLVLSEVLDSLPKGKVNGIKGLLGWLTSDKGLYVNSVRLWRRIRGRAVEVGGGEGRPRTRPWTWDGTWSLLYG